MTTVRLNDEMEKKLSILTELEKKTKSELIKKALLVYYENHTRKKSPYDLGKDLFGKYGSNEEDLSEKYKTIVMEKLNEKYSH